MSRFLILAAVALSACSSSRMVSTWTAPLDRPLELDRRRVAVILVTADDSLRRASEDALAREISKGGAQGNPSYTLLSAERLQDPEAAKRALSEANVVGALLLRVVSSESSPDPEWHSRPPYSSLWDYWSHPSPAVATDDPVLVEVLLYSVSDDRLLWAGRSETTDPSDTADFLRGLAKDVRNALKTAGFVR